MLRKGNQGAFEVLVARYNSRLLSFCRHMLGSREDAEDVLQDVLTASYNAMLADDRPINVRPWLYRIARNRCLNHLRRNRAVGVDSMDIHFAEHGATTADKVHEREEFRQLLHDIRDLPETQRTALVLREMDALSYEQIAEAMETTVSSVKSLLVRARVSLTEAAEARLLTCEEVREELAEIAEGIRRKQSASVRRHVKACSRCEVFQGEMKKSSRALAALAPIGPFALLHKLLFAHAASHSAGSAGVAGAAGAGAGGAGAAGAAGAAAGGGSAGLLTAGVGAVATKAAAGIAAAALVTAGTVAIDHNGRHRPTGPSASVLVHRSLNAGLEEALGGNSRLAGSVGAGPGLSTAVIFGKTSKSVRKDITHHLLAIGSTVSKGSRAPKHETKSGNGPAHNTHSTAATQTQHLLTPPPNPETPATNDAVVDTTGGSGLGTPGSSATNSTASATLSTQSTNTAPFDTSTTGTTSTSGSTGTSTTGATGTTTTGTGTGTTTGTTTSPTTTGTSTSPTTTTTPADTTTTPADTTTTPADTTTTPADTTTAPATTTTTPADTTTGADTTPAQPATGTTTGS
jgi:RNA polymerase sigma factor (sigma-70 family)